MTLKYIFTTKQKRNNQNSSINSLLIVLLLVFAFLFIPQISNAQNDTINKKNTKFGVKVRIGGRYDNLRMCVASAPGAKGGTAADISFFMEFTNKNNKALHIDIPIFRPIFFGAAFKMLQFEPTVGLRMIKNISDKTDLKIGPTLGLSLHYGPDYKYEDNGIDPYEPFFAAGPILGAYLGLEFKRPNKKTNIEIGISPYVTPLFGNDNNPNHNGIVIGGLLDISFVFNS